MDSIERPNISEWAHKDKTVRNSRGKCLCQSLYQCHGCGGYQPSQDKFCPARCVNLDPADYVTCKVSE